MNASQKSLDKLDRLQERALKICLKAGADITLNILLSSTNTAKLVKRRNAHLLNFMYKKKQCIELLDIKNVHTRARDAVLFKTIIPRCEKYKHSVFFFYKGATTWNSLPVTIRNIDTYDLFKELHIYFYCTNISSVSADFST